MAQNEHLRNFGMLAILIIILCALPSNINLYQRSVIMFTMMYVVLSLSWNIISGYTGYVSFGHVMFYGIGAYATGILVVDYGWHWIPTLFVGVFVSFVV